MRPSDLVHIAYGRSCGLGNTCNANVCHLSVVIRVVYTLHMHMVIRVIPNVVIARCYPHPIYVVIQYTYVVRIMIIMSLLIHLVTVRATTKNMYVI